ncbi:outer membrane beta-barrel protein [Olivibacter domesticus]|uniref:Opacity protein n=1 Tax=Olivibacter domesticus TaxID=407022 RepID=A0A1H7K261_OLID1|nr:outer membrane beta-barrel protein [Olivibacter domesticus]SEK80684.1 Opacity protein [Olivibacter domesticus]
MKNFSTKLFVAILFLLVCFTRNSFAQGGGTFYLGYGVATANSIEDVITDIVITTATGGAYKVADSKYSGAIFGGYRAYITKKLEFGGTFVYENSSKDLLSESTKAGSVSTNTYAVLAELKYNYINHENFRLHSGLGAGVAHARSSTQDDVIIEKDKTTDFAYQVDAIGISYGHPFSISLNLGYGYKGIANLVLAYRLGRL